MCLTEPIPRKDKLAKFESRIERIPESGCWLWTGLLSNVGYGKIGVGTKTESTHRHSYEMFIGEIPKGMQVLHRCDIRCCVNPNHLYLGTQSDNIRDMYAKGRFRAKHWKNNPY